MNPILSWTVCKCVYVMLCHAVCQYSCWLTVILNAKCVWYRSGVKIFFTKIALFALRYFHEGTDFINTNYLVAFFVLYSYSVFENDIAQTHWSCEYLIFFVYSLRKWSMHLKYKTWGSGLFHKTPTTNDSGVCATAVKLWLEYYTWAAIWMGLE